ncbi:MAG: hypothetical protein H0Z35_04035 [Thermoanaerobacteraceae bacterium]|nr:hypothetical protein [Thermoanaerobacteraceae bacterium]
MKIKGIKIALLGYNVLGPLEQGRNPADLKEEIKCDLETLKDRADRPLFHIIAFHVTTCRAGLNPPLC